MKDKLEQYKNALRKAHRQEIEKFLLENLEDNLRLENRFQVNFAKYLRKKTKEEIKNLFTREWMEISDRGYISEEIGFTAMHILYEYTSKINTMLEEENIEESINYVEGILEAIGEFQIDGSYGEHGDIIDTFKEIMQKIIIESKKEEREKFINWLQKYMEIKDELYDFKYEFKNLIHN